MTIIVTAVGTGEIIATGTDLWEVAGAAAAYGGFTRTEIIQDDRDPVVVQAHDFEEPDGFGIDFTDHPEAGWGPTQAELVLREIRCDYSFAEGIEERIIHNDFTKIEFCDGSFLIYDARADRWEAGHDDPS